MNRRLFAILSLAALASLAPAVADAEPVLLLLTEQVDRPDQPELEENFWWSRADSPAWTTSDRAIIEELRQAGVETASPTDLSRVSRIYRVPGLSAANAVALGSVLGVSRVIVGTIHTAPIEGAEPLGMVGRRVTVDARMVRPGEQGVVVEHRFQVVRDRFAFEADQAVAEARAQAAGALARVVSAATKRRIADVGVRAGETLLGIANARRGEVLEEIRSYLAELEAVGGARVAWAAEGVVAMEVNPESRDDDATVRRIAKSLEAHEFEGFALTGANRERWKGVVELRVTEKTVRTP